MANLFYDCLYDGEPEPSESNHGLADIKLGWRRLLFTNRSHVITFQAHSIIPTGYMISMALLVLAMAGLDPKAVSYMTGIANGLKNMGFWTHP